MTDVVMEAVREQGYPVSSVILVHCDLGRVEWKGTKELAQAHALHYGLRFEVVKRDQDLLDHIEARGMFPDSQARYCTSDHKRSQVYKLFTRITSERRRWQNRLAPVKILNVMGIRAEESPARAKRLPFYRDGMASNGKRHVDQWLPIFDWKLAQVWTRIRQSGVPHHYAYDLGMPRLSCCFCIFAPKAALLLAGKHNPELLAEYVRVETKNNHTLRKNQSLKSIQDELATGAEVGKVADWAM
jgi:3'-phosphoadenosine 5'-phosphosulfate sulfotransferase (PAPS reductase)/FAD synthetase